MYTLIVENQYGQQLELTHNEKYAVKSVLGLDPPDAVINTTKYAGQDGSAYNSSYMNNRVITITMAINYPAEQNRIELYKFFKSKFPVRIFYKNTSRDVWIDGYVQTFSVAYFDKKETAQIVIICPSPHLNSNAPDTDVFSNTLRLFEFPFSIASEGIPFSQYVEGLETPIINYGDLETGMIIRITASGNVTNPKLINATTGSYIKVLDTMSDGDVITINTRSGEKSIRKISNGVDSNLISKLAYGSEWLTLVPGENLFSITADAGTEYVDVSMEINYQFEGV